MRVRTRVNSYETSSAVFVAGRLTRAELSRAEPNRAEPTADSQALETRDGRHAYVPRPDLDSTPGEPERGKAVPRAPFAVPLRTAPLLT